TPNSELRTGIMLNSEKDRKIYIAIPLMDELETLPELLECIRNQDFEKFEVYFCVNQPDSWWEDYAHKALCERNQASIAYLKQHCTFPFRIIDKSSKGNGWQGKQLGVGWARKVLMDAITEEASTEDIIITLDGDTSFSKHYFRSVLDNFNANPDAVGLSVPYYHKLSGSNAEDRAILRYEIYMRNYAINLWRIKNPYRFTALGSAMALPVSSYRAIGGMTPKKSGEDFYFLQKLTKYGRLMSWNEEKVYPAARFSDRVFFGTGPAMIKGASGDWDSYPIYHHAMFDEVERTYNTFDELFDKDVPTPIDRFIEEVLKQHDIWTPLRNNARTVDQFRRACRDKIDGLRILQYLKHTQNEKSFNDENCLLEFFNNYHPEAFIELDFLSKGLNFDEISVSQLDSIRNFLVGIEDKYQKKDHYA
ncbi:MAG: hypothetical protein KAT76_07865, partial [Bacteroidales bacterium]|nr:hypothetical protein [Bacteroidales bacterium]